MRSRSWRSSSRAARASACRSSLRCAPSPRCRSAASTGSSTSPCRTASTRGIDNVVVLTQYNPRSLNDHIGLGRPWDLDRNNGGVQAAPAVHRARPRRRVVRRDGRRGAPELQRDRARAGTSILVLAGDHIYKMDYQPFIAAHRRKRADVTIAVRRVPLAEATRMGILALDDNDKVVEWQEKPKHPKSDLASMGVYVFSKRALRALAQRGPASTSAATSSRRCSTAVPASSAITSRATGRTSARSSRYWEANLALLEDQPGARPVRPRLADPHPVRGARAGPGRPDGAGPPEPDQPRLRDQRDGREQRAVAGRPGRRRRGRARFDRDVRLGDPLRRGRRPGDPRQGGRRRAGGDRRRRARTSTRRTARSRAGSTPGSRSSASGRSSRAASRIGRNVKIAGDVKVDRLHVAGRDRAARRRVARPGPRPPGSPPRSRRRRQRSGGRRKHAGGGTRPARPTADGRPGAATRPGPRRRPHRPSRVDCPPCLHRDSGVGPCGPADVERWLDELGLVPWRRADRDGVTSWDLRLDGTPARSTCRSPLILDPALALICWVHFAPPIGDAFRKSFRKLLRWNDEFPFVKFSLGRGRPAVLLASRSRSRRPSGTRSGWRSPASLAIADRLLEESVQLALDRRAGSRPTAARPRPSPVDGSRTRLGELGTPGSCGRARRREPDAADGAGRREATARSARSALARRGAGVSVAAAGRRPPARRHVARSRRPSPALTLVAARRPTTTVRRALRRRSGDRRVRVAVDLRANHTDGHEDPPVLLRPRVPGRPAAAPPASGSRGVPGATVGVANTTKDATRLLRIEFGSASCGAARRRRTG